ncbi:MAG: methyltransferase domain-containing protein [Proteobacteria bacterium]|nr:methyltransferase domain-containing protein [Pseudomonadota bacterium]
MVELSYDTLEKLRVPRPVDRLDHIAGICRGRHVLDIGCLDETALAKRDTNHWLHGRIGQVAASVTGVDLSERLPAEGLVTGPNSRIHRGNGLDPHPPGLDDAAIEVIVAGEFIEHVDSPIAFMAAMKDRFPGRELVLSTPNGLAFANTLMGMIGREAQHPDHIHLFTAKVLHTLCRRAGIGDYQLVPYRFYATEMILGSTGVKQLAARASEPAIRAVEWCFPLLSFGYILHARL